MHWLLAIGRRWLDAAIGVPSDYKSRPNETVLPGLLLASEFGTALGRQLMEQPHVSELTWAAEPFAGIQVRPDNVSEILYGLMHLGQKMNQAGRSGRGSGTACMAATGVGMGCGWFSRTGCSG